MKLFSAPMEMQMKTPVRQIPPASVSTVAVTRRSEASLGNVGIRAFVISGDY